MFSGPGAEQTNHPARAPALTCHGARAGAPPTSLQRTAQKSWMAGLRRTEVVDARPAPAMTRYARPLRQLVHLFRYRPLGDALPRDGNVARATITSPTKWERLRRARVEREGDRAGTWL